MLSYGQLVRQLLVEQAAPAQWELRRGCSSALYRGILPTFFPVIYDSVSGQLAEPCILFLYKRYLRGSKKRRNRRTLIAMAEDLRDWLRHLEDFGFSWAQITTELLDGYVTSLEETISPKTGEELKGTTIRRRVSTVVSFYAWSSENIHIPGIELTPDSLLSPGVAENYELGDGIGVSTYEASPLRPVDAQTILPLLGNYPSEVCHLWRELSKLGIGEVVYQVPPSGRKRLACEIPLQCGLRVEEVSELPVGAFSQYLGREAQIFDTGQYSFQVRGKGDVVRNVDISGVLLKEVVAYIKCERAVIAEMTGRSSKSLLIHGMDSGTQWAGRKIGVRTLQRMFETACKAAGYIELRYVVRDVASESQHSDTAGFSKFKFHDLRHTFAIWTYYARQRSGDAEPWLYVQKQLGHRFLSTTLNIYLRLTKDFERDVSDRFMRWAKR